MNKWDKEIIDNFYFNIELLKEEIKYIDSKEEEKWILQVCVIF